MLITGATAGIGKATALHFARAGIHIVAAARGTEAGRALVEEINGSGGEATFVRADMNSERDIQEMVQVATDVYGGLDFAFNNAGIFGVEADLHEQDDDYWEQVLAVNLSGVYRCMKYEIAAMLDRQVEADQICAVVNNASTVGHRGSASSGAAYTASKHGVVGLTRQAAIDYAGTHIRINAVAPGPTLTEITAPILDLPEENRTSHLAALNPFAELVSADEVAATVAFLCSGAAKMINGQSIPIDGGQLARL